MRRSVLITKDKSIDNTTADRQDLKMCKAAEELRVQLHLLR